MNTAEQSPTPHRRLRDIAHDGIRDAILNGALEPGERLEAARLEDRLGTPVAAIHDAMTALAAEGLLNGHEDESFSVVDPDPATVGDTLKTIGVLMGGVVRQTLPALSPAGIDLVLEHVNRVHTAAQYKDPRSHAERTLEFYAALLHECPNLVLASLTRACLVPLSYHYLVTIDRRTLDWAAIASSWHDLREAVLHSDQIRGELAIEALHGLPVTPNPSSTST